MGETKEIVLDEHVVEPPKENPVEEPKSKPKLILKIKRTPTEETSSKPLKTYKYRDAMGKEKIREKGFNKHETNHLWESGRLHDARVVLNARNYNEFYPKPLTLVQYLQNTFFNQVYDLNDNLCKSKGLTRSSLTKIISAWYINKILNLHHDQTDHFPEGNYARRFFNGLINKSPEKANNVVSIVKTTHEQISKQLIEHFKGFEKGMSTEEKREVMSHLMKFTDKAVIGHINQHSTEIRKLYKDRIKSHN